MLSRSRRPVECVEFAANRTAGISLDLFKAFGLAMVAVFWPYDGWINIGPVAEEIREPQRNVPLGLGLGVLVVTLVYCGANVGYHLRTAAGTHTRV